MKNLFKVDALNKANLFHRFLLFTTFICGMRIGMKKWLVWSYFAFTSLCFSFTILGCIVTAANEFDTLLKIQIIMRLLLTVTVIWIFLYYSTHSTLVNNTLSKYNDKSPNYVGNEEMNIFIENSTKMIRFELALYMVLIIAQLVVGIYVEIKDKHLYDFMDLYSCGSSSEKPVIWVCFNRGSIGYVILNNVLKFPFVFYQAFIAWLGEIILVLNFEGIATKLQIYNRLSLTCAAKVHKLKKFGSEDCQQLTILIEYQKKIIGHIQEMKSVTYTANTLHVIFFYIMFLFVILPVTSQNNRLEFLNLPLMVAASYVGYIHYVLCKHWLTINSAQEHFSCTLLEFPWYERSMKFKKLYLMTLQLNQKCYPTKVFGIYTVDLKFFSVNMNRLYSLLSLLRLR